MKDVVYIMEQLSKHGEAYIVGGSVRDIVMNIQSHDIDIATNVSMEKIEEMFETIDIGKNKDFGVLIVRHNNSSYEVAHYRCDGKYSDGRRPDEIQLTQSLEDDVKRRDFTINGMAMDLHGNIVDHVNGKEDIQNKIIRCIGDPYKRIAEDKLRMLRAVRFAARFDFAIEPITFRAIQDNAHTINDISVERIRDELYKMAKQPDIKFAKAIRLLKYVGLLKHILPEIDCMDQYEHTITTHPEGNVYAHTLACIEYSSNFVEYNPLLNLALLFHDIGKPVTRDYNEQGIVRYIGHEHAGVKVAEEVCDRLKISQKDSKAILFVIEYHMLFHRIDKIKKSKLFKIIDNPYFDLLYTVGYCDDMCRNLKDTTDRWRDIQFRIDNLLEHLDEFKTMSKLKQIINGEKIMSLCNISPGPEVGRIQKYVIDYIINNDISIQEISVIDDIILKFKQAQ